MSKNKKELLESAPWRVEKEDDKFKDAKIKVISHDGKSTMYAPPKTKYNNNNNNNNNNTKEEEYNTMELDPQLRYSFQRNYQFIQRVFSIDTIVKPLPPAMAYNVSRNLSFFTRIFTQFFDPEGISNAQKSLGIGQEEKARSVR